MLKIKDVWLDIVQLASTEAGLTPDPNEQGSFIGTDEQFEKFEMLLQDYENYTLDEIHQMTGGYKFDKRIKVEHIPF